MRTPAFLRASAPGAQPRAFPRASALPRAVRAASAHLLSQWSRRIRRGATCSLALPPAASPASGESSLPPPHASRRRFARLRGPAVDWPSIGRHTVYGNGAARTLARGWVHALSLVCLEALLACSAAGVLPGGHLTQQAAALVRATSLGFYGSVLFHCVPWAKPSSYNVALALDFMAITGSVTSQIAAWTGPLSAATTVSAALSAATAALCWAGLRQAKQPLWQFARLTRRNLVLAQITLLSVVEAFALPDWRCTAAVWASRWIAFLWYVTFARHDAERTSGLTNPNVWGEHDTFHAMCSVTAALQIAGTVLG